MRTSQKFLWPLLFASVLLSACGSSSSSSGTASQPSTSQPALAGSSALVKTASNATVGATILVDSKGMSLYRLSGEQGGKFICASATCVHVWPPLTPQSGSAPTGVASLGTVKRPDGTEQVTYKGMPLYTFAKDHAPGDALGQGLKDVGVWSTVSASKPSTPAPAPTPAPASGGGYGY